MTTGQEFPIFQKDLYELFGDPVEDADYLKVLDFSEFSYAFSHVRDFEGRHWKCRIYGHELMADPLRKAFRLIVDRGLFDELKTWDGCFNIRPVKGGSRPSTHSWGLANDFNAATNPFSRELITDLSDEFIKCFAESGFEWGGLWGHPYFDPMHFQLPLTRDWSTSDNPLAPKEA